MSQSQYYMCSNPVYLFLRLMQELMMLNQCAVVELFEGLMPVSRIFYCMKSRDGNLRAAGKESRTQPVSWLIRLILQFPTMMMLFYSLRMTDSQFGMLKVFNSFKFDVLYSLSYEEVAMRMLSGDTDTDETGPPKANPRSSKYGPSIKLFFYIQTDISPASSTKTTVPSSLYLGHSIFTMGFLCFEEYSLIFCYLFQWKILPLLLVKMQVWKLEHVLPAVTLKPGAYQDILLYDAQSAECSIIGVRTRKQKICSNIILCLVLSSWYLFIICQQEYVLIFLELFDSNQP